MGWSEFDLIQWITSRAYTDASVSLGIGDDAALIHPSLDHELVVATDTSVAGTHFPSDIPPVCLGHKVLSVTLSDMAAMGATPRWILLSMTLPALDKAWLTDFFKGFFTLADRYQVGLVGGDTTRGQEQNIAVTVLGEVSKGQALKRGGAQVGDSIYVSGTLGGAGLAFQLWQEQQLVGHPCQKLLEQAWYCPEPQLATGITLRGKASAAIDVSDGLLVDLQHILEASGVGAEVNVANLPLCLSLEDLSEQDAWSIACCGGEDYALCFTSQFAEAYLRGVGVDCVKIGQVTSEKRLVTVDQMGNLVKLRGKGYEHFS